MHRYCGKNWTEEDIERIRTIITSSPSATRSALSRVICQEFNWLKPDGGLKDMSCRVAMLRMHREGLIVLPPSTRPPIKTRTLFTSERSDPKPTMEIPLDKLINLRVDLVLHKKDLSLWNEYVSRYHYLGYKMLPGAQLRYLIKAGDDVLGAMGFGAAAWKVEHRDKFIGWAPDIREKNLHLIVNQSRFLILPWVKCKNLATKSLSLVARRIAQDWRLRYAYTPVLMETFVDTTRFQGTCYKAGNWLNIGLTKGRGKLDRHNKCNVPVKSIWLMPLKRDFKFILLNG